VISHPAIKPFASSGSFAVSTHKPIFVRWAEEAEAKQVWLWAGLTRDASCAQAPSSSHPLLLLCSRAWAALLHRVRSLRQAVDALPEAERWVYELRDLEDLSGKEVSATLRISLASMKSRLHRAREKVRNYLDAALRPSARAQAAE